MNATGEQNSTSESSSTGPEGASNAGSGGFFYDFIFIFFLVGFLAACLMLVMLNEHKKGLDNKALAQVRDRYINEKICPNESEICAVQSVIYRERMRDFALKEDVTPNQLKARMEVLKTESLDAALKKLSAKQDK